MKNQLQVSTMTMTQKIYFNLSPYHRSISNLIEQLHVKYSNDSSSTLQYWNNLSIKNHFFNQMVLVELYSTELMLKNIEKWTRIQINKHVHISWVHLKENTANVFNNVPIYSWMKWFWSNSTVLKRGLKIKWHLKEFKQRNVSIFHECTFIKTQLMFLTKCLFIHANLLHPSNGFGWTL